MLHFYLILDSDSIKYNFELTKIKKINIFKRIDKN